MSLPKTNKKTTFLLAALMVILLGIMVYVINQRYILPKSMMSDENIQMEIEQIQTQSDSDNLDSIEKDLNDTELNNIDKELMDIEKEMDQAY